MTLNDSYDEIRLILGDQLNAKHSWYKNKSSKVLYLVCELHQEMDYCKHHIQKVAAFFCAMEHFATALKKAGHHVLHLNLDDTKDHKSLESLVKALCKQYQASTFAYQLCDEWRLKEQLSDLSLGKNVKVQGYDSEHFMLGFEELEDYFEAKTHQRMESFYRKMRKRFKVLMDGDDPIGGQWNFDEDNRQKLKKSDLDDIPAPLTFSNDISDILKRIEKHKVKTIGSAQKQLLWPVTRSQATELLAFFCEHLLPHFGTFQDAMTGRSEHQWSLYHSRLSFALNTKMLHPKQVISAAIEAYEESDDINIAQIEGFVRQIIGWREYVRGMYWANMPSYSEQNYFAADADLPEYFWQGETKMNCMAQAISQSLDYAYAHHIQRLMITGNFCLLAGIDPAQVDGWYLGIYIDAIEWVELPNTRGMSQFADGGLIATKPYCGGGNYINKMSDYCQDCHYKVKEKTSEDACPFNSLYWHFIASHRDKLGKNHRLGMIYRNWDKQDDSKKQATLKRARWCLDNIESL